MEKYNNRVRGTAKMTPFEMITNTNKPIPNPILNDNENFPKFQVGDYVGVPDKRHVYSKRDTTNWKRELFKIHKVKKRIQ